MTTKYFNTLVFVGRMQPFHIGHKAVIDRALELAHEVVIVLGSANQARSTKNPFTASERKQMISSVYADEYNYLGAQGRIKQPRVQIVEVMDYPYDDNAWVSAVQNSVNSVKTIHDPNLVTGLIGHSKDHSSYYLKIFPDWRKHVEVDNVDGINATDIRNEAYETGFFETDLIPLLTRETLSRIISPTVWEYLKEEHRSIKEYHDLWKGAPFPPTFVTTDAVLTQSGYILLIKRGGFPFKNQWALPGGYLDLGQRVEDNMIKELREETCVKVPDKVLRGSITGRSLFDHPDRDPRGRTITHGFHVDLGYPIEKLPKVKGADDAKEARWFHLSDVKSEMMAFDHFAIIKHFIRT